MKGDAPAAEPAGVVSRRIAVKLGAAACAGLVTGAGVSAWLTRGGPRHSAPYRFLTPAEATVVIALCEQIIPRDDTPGATDAGVVHFIDQQLATRLRRHRATYRLGLAALTATCVAQHGRPFPALSPEQQLALLQQIEAGRINAQGWRGVAPAEFFRLVVSHTMQGFYGSPRHGGNRGYVSYRILGLDQPQILGRNRHPPG